jgi:hypothetical protein
MLSRRATHHRSPPFPQVPPVRNTAPNTVPNTVPNTQLLTLLTLTSLLLNACGSSKISQCNALITQINQTSTNLGKVQTPNTATSSTINTEELGNSLETFAQELGKNIKTIEAIGVDTPLQPLKTRLITAYQTTATHTKALSQAIKTQNQTAAQTAQNQLMQASSSEKQLLKEFTAYCQAPETK